MPYAKQFTQIESLISQLANNPLQTLEKTVLNLAGLLTSATEFQSPDFKLLYEKLIADMLVEIRNCELHNNTREEILQVMQPFKQLFVHSELARRMQEWPRGYAGDFETIHYLYTAEHISKPGSLTDIIEQEILNLPIVLQHRYKIKHQSEILRHTILNKKDNSLIGIIGCGESADLASIQEEIAQYYPTVILNDMDTDALAASKKNCHLIKNLTLINDNCLKALRSMTKYGKFDLILAGGLLDYFPNDRTTTIVSLALKLLKEDGHFFFTNIAKGHHFRVYMEYVANWFLYEKSKEELLEICIKAGADPDHVKIELEETGLTYLVTINARQK